MAKREETDFAFSRLSESYGKPLSEDEKREVSNGLKEFFEILQGWHTEQVIEGKGND